MAFDHSAPRRHAGRPASADPRLFPWWAFYILFVVYGSLVPLDFQPHAWDQAWNMFRHIQLLDVGAQGRADWVANGVLYLPVGFLTVALLSRARSHPGLALALLGSLMFSVALATTIEFAQLFFPPRTVSINDIFAECVGSILGALFALRWSDRFRALLATLTGNSDRLLAHLLKAYAIAYVAFSLFPYDFLVSTTELGWKLLSDKWGWLIATDALQNSRTHYVFKLLAEALAVIPLGWMLGHRAATRRDRKLVQIFLAGATLGLVIEIAQFFIVSGVSQGISILTRGAGMLAGAWLWRQRAHLQPAYLASACRRHILPVGILYMLVLAAMNGWFDFQWTGIDSAIHALKGVRFLPFYYHYYTTEQAALLSLAAVALMYAPIGVGTWATWLRPGMALWLATLAAGVMETSKLFLKDQHPDPTNLLLGGFAAWATAHLVKRLSTPATSSPVVSPPNTPSAAVRQRKRHTHTRSRSIDQPVSDDVRLATSAPELGTDRLNLPSMTGYLVLLGVVLWAAWEVVSFPVQPLMLGVFLLGYIAILWVRPHYVFIAIPAALPLFDFAAWSGRFFLDAFDLLLILGMTVAYIRVPRKKRKRRADAVLFLLTALLGLVFIISTVRGMSPWQLPDINALSHYYSPYNALRIAKGALWAFLLFGLYRRLDSAEHDVRRLFAWGMVAGLAGTVGVIVWERIAFPGLLNFTDVYRVTGPFSGMHIGGADIETYLTVSMPFLVWVLFTSRNTMVRFAGTGLMLAATYALMVTFSRVGYAGYAAALVVALLAIVLASDQRALTPRLKRGAAALGLIALALALAVPVLTAPFAQGRLSQSGTDLETRRAHWSDALSMRDSDWATTLFGMGIGRYPETHNFRSAETHAATYRLVAEAGNVFMRLGSGSPLYIEQFVDVDPRQTYTLSLNLRSNQPQARLGVSVCEKWLLTSARCVFRDIEIAATGQWKSFQILLPALDAGSAKNVMQRPVKLSFFNPAAQALLDVDKLSLRNGNGNNLVANGEFAKGLDHWFFTADNDKPWHIWSMPIQVLFDQGWLGVLALGLFVGLGLWRAGRDAWHGNAMSGAMLASSVGFLVIGTLDSLVDSPRLIFVFLLLMGFCGQTGVRSPAD